MSSPCVAPDKKLRVLHTRSISLLTPFHLLQLLQDPAFMKMSGNQVPVGGIQKDARMTPGAGQQGTGNIAGDMLSHIQKETLLGMQSAVEAIQWKGGDPPDKFKSNRCAGAQEDVGFGQDALKLLAKAVDVFLNSPLPGVASMAGTPYSYVPGMTP